MDKNMLYLVGVAIVVVLLLSSYHPPPSAGVQAIAGSWDISEAVNDSDYNQYLIETSDFDFSNPEVYAVANQIKTNSVTPEEAIKQTITYVARNVKYSGAISASYCYEEKASSVLSSKKGDCVSMSRLVTALLRAQGIPARTMGGCLSSGIRCSPLMAVIPGEEPKTTPMVAGDFKKRGYLHEYVEVWTPTEGWRIIEATSGQIFDMSCLTYLDYGYDKNNYDRCVISDSSFWNTCASY